jgi:hypothetical protein
MKRHVGLVVIAGNLVALLGLALVYPQLMLSPGPLYRAHAELAADCLACHAPLRGASAARCMSCHAVPAIGLRTTKGVAIEKVTRKAAFHQHLRDQECMSCHREHEGPELTQRSRSPFSHALLQPAIRTRCESCHQAPSNALHRGVTGGCLQCHTQDHWKPATFDHAKSFVLEGDHRTECVTCHVKNDYSRYTCYGCHEHQVDRIRAKHLRKGIREFEDCVRCHRSADDDGDEGEARSGRERERD